MLVGRLKTVGTIEGTLETHEGVSHTDGIKYDKRILDALPIPYTIVEFKEYALGIAIGVKKADGATTYISHKWVSSIAYQDTGFKLLSNMEKVGAQYIKISNNNLIDLTNMSIVPMDSLPICSECGRIATEVVNGKKICTTCLTDKYAQLNNYSYKPSPKFTGEHLKGDVENNVYYGIELEYGLHGKIDMGRLVFQHKEEVYLKSDGSIHGGDFRAELVSHPHTFKKLMSGESFINKLDTLNDEEHPRENGCHIHISRTAFVDNKHYAKWYFLMHELKRLNEFIGGRELTGYCQFKAEGKISRKKKDFKGSDRRVMINETNDNTIECRFFSSSSKSSVVKMYVQYIESLIKYTKYSDDVVEIDGWRQYVHKYKDKYNFLSDKLLTYTGNLTGIVEYREPILMRKIPKEVSMFNLSKIVGIKLFNGSKYTEITGATVYSNNTMYFYYVTSGRKRDISINLEDISEVEWEE